MRSPSGASAALARPLLMLATLGAAALGAVSCETRGAPEPAPASAGDDRPAAPEPGGVPNAEAWSEITLRSAKVRFRVPEGAEAKDEHAGHDDAFAGSRFRVTMPSGYDVLFAERHADPADEIRSERRRYEAMGDEPVRVLYAADDAIVVHRDGTPPVGAHCEVTACGGDVKHPICAVQEGARVEGRGAFTLTESECLAVVSIARSIARR
jgi:hypothetical protein